jgi:hypothetical protein
MSDLVDTIEKQKDQRYFEYENRSKFKFQEQFVDKKSSAAIRKIPK